MSRSFLHARRIVAVALFGLATTQAEAQTTLGSFSFGDGLFGNTLHQSDGGAHASQAHLRTGPVAPSAPGYLTGVGFNTGIANINRVVYTIGYDTGILNNDGDDLGVVTARFSGDAFEIAVSTDGSTFSPSQIFNAGTAVSTGVVQSFYYAGYPGLFSASLFVQPLDLSSFGVGIGQSIMAVRITGYPELDLLRVAGFSSAAHRIMPPVFTEEEEEEHGPASESQGPEVTVTPEPATYALMAVGLIGLVGMRRRRSA